MKVRTDSRVVFVCRVENSQQGTGSVRLFERPTFLGSRGLLGGLLLGLLLGSSADLEGGLDFDELVEQSGKRKNKKDENK